MIKLTNDAMQLAIWWVSN